MLAWFKHVLRTMPQPDNYFQPPWTWPSYGWTSRLIVDICPLRSRAFDRVHSLHPKVLD